MTKSKQVFHNFTYGLFAFSYFLFVIGLNFVIPSNSSALTVANFALNPGLDANIINPAYRGLSDGDALNVSENYFTNASFNQTSILIKDFPTLGDLALAYSPTRSEYFGKNIQDVGPIGRDDNIEGAGELFYTFTYFCDASNGRIGKNSFGPSVNEFKIEYAVGLFPIYDSTDVLTSQFAAKNNYRVAAGPIRIDREYAATEGRSDQLVFKIWDDGEPQKIGPQHITSRFNRINGSGVPAGCTPESIRGEAQIANYNKLPAAQKEEFAAAAAASPIGSVDDPEDKDTCDFKFTAPMTWIICPVIDMGIAMTDTVFEDFIKPLMEEVPVSTNPDDGSYKAWQQFRLIGNIVLVGAMIAVVYAQVKGG